MACKFKFEENQKVAKKRREKIGLLPERWRRKGKGVAQNAVVYLGLYSFRGTRHMPLESTYASSFFIC